VEGKNNNSVLFSKLYYNDKDNSSLVIDTPSSIFSFDFLEVSIG
jgi:hypothetical protein